ncbi:hypothetical protein ACVWWG_007400 [Bradyrhizobium sp. LB7.2]
MNAAEAKGRLELVAVDDPRAVGHDAAIVGHRTRHGQHGPLRRFAAGPAPEDIDNGFPDGREVCHLHIVDRSGLIALTEREARIGAADIGEKNRSCLADGHVHMAAAALPAAGTSSSVLSDRKMRTAFRIRPRVDLVNTHEAKPLHPLGLMAAIRADRRTLRWLPGRSTLEERSAPVARDGLKWTLR